MLQKMIRVEIHVKNQRLSFQEDSKGLVIPVDMSMNINAKRFGVVKDASSRFWGGDLRFPIDACYSVIKRKRIATVEFHLQHDGILELNATTDHSRIYFRVINIFESELADAELD